MNSPSEPSATGWEREALDCRHNLADGHARQAPNPAQMRVIERLAEFALDDDTPHWRMADAFLFAQFELASQNFMALDRHPELHRAGTDCIEIAARVVRKLRRDAKEQVRVGFGYPTFDSLVDNLRGEELVTLPLPVEDLWVEPALSGLRPGKDAVFVVVPNNPTGHEPTEQQFQAFLERCVQLDLVVIVDFSFRHFSSGLANWDQYEMAMRVPGLKAMFIEDTGKTWNTKEEKVATLSATPNLQTLTRTFGEAHSLGPSPMALQWLRGYIEADIEERLRRQPTSYRKVVDVNRRMLHQTLRALPFAFKYQPGARMPVEWIQLPKHWNSLGMSNTLLGWDIGVLDGNKFYMNRQGEGRIRVALSRTPERFSDAMRDLVLAVNEYAATVDRRLGAMPGPAANPYITTTVIA